MRFHSVLHPAAVLVTVALAWVLIAADAPDPDRGKELFETVCTSCHTLTPPAAKAPPMMMVAGHYMQTKQDVDGARAAMLAWISAPDAARSLLPAHAVERFGLMAPLNLKDDDLEAVVGYVLDTWQEAGQPAPHGPGCEGDSCGTGMRGMGMRMRRGMPRGLNQDSDGSTVCPPGMCGSGTMRNGSAMPMRRGMMPDSVGMPMHRGVMQEGGAMPMCRGMAQDGGSERMCAGRGALGTGRGLNQDSSGATLPPAMPRCACAGSCPARTPGQ